MIAERIINGLLYHKQFIFNNLIVHILAGLFIPSIVYPFLSKEYKKIWNYFLLVFFPALFGSIFPDLIFALSTWIKERSLDNLFYLLTHGGDVYTSFHFGFPLILVVPTTLFFVLVLNRAFNRQYFDNLPKYKLLSIALISLISALMHIGLDLVGF
ncbi:hypothetical protein HZB88_05250 [archaeon]|nr:hypothetical protein [archaeon]